MVAFKLSWSQMGIIFYILLSGCWCFTYQKHFSYSIRNICCIILYPKDRMQLTWLERVFLWFYWQEYFCLVFPGPSYVGMILFWWKMSRQSSNLFSAPSCRCNCCWDTWAATMLGKLHLQPLLKLHLSFSSKLKKHGKTKVIFSSVLRMSHCRTSNDLVIIKRSWAGWP